MKEFDQIVFKLLKDKPELTNFNRGIEKEGLRVTNAAKMAQTSHSNRLGSKLTHPYITTDYGESLLEFITPVESNIDHTIEFLKDLHRITYLQSGELIWSSSIPCILEGDAKIKIADFGKSNIGKLKKIYREGLNHRYGKSMQSIAGLHYNFSLPDAFWTELKNEISSDDSIIELKNQYYFRLIRNFRRYHWILYYLFGASPVVDKSFIENKTHDLESITKNTWGLPFATSLRMGKLGYTSDAQKEINLCFNGLESYIDSLENARLQSYPPYEKIGLKDDEGNYKQLNTGILQIDNEFYSPIRPKHVAKSCQSALQALHKNGVEYIEIRCLDLNPFCEVGIDESSIKFLDAFLMFCLLGEEEVIEKTECDEIKSNVNYVVNNGRNPELVLVQKGQTITLKDYGLEIIEKIKNVGEVLESSIKGTMDAINWQQKKFMDSDMTPSGRIMGSLKQKQLSFVEFTLQQSVDNRSFLREKHMLESTLREYEKIAKDSLLQQKEIEQSDEIEFDEFLAQYYEKIKI